MAQKDFQLTVEKTWLKKKVQKFERFQHEQQQHSCIYSVEINRIEGADA